MNSTCVISIIRLCTLDSAATSPDSTWSNTQAALWSILELTVAMTAACLPTLRPFVSRFFPRLMASISNNQERKESQSDGKGNNIVTWGSAGQGFRRHKAGDSTDQLYTERAIVLKDTTPPGADPLASVTGGPINYKVSVNSPHLGNDSDSTISPSEFNFSHRDLERGAMGSEHNIRATTVIKQEFERP